jgi:hypothetical protein
VRARPPIALNSTYTITPTPGLRDGQARREPLDRNGNRRGAQNVEGGVKLNTVRPHSSLGDLAPLMFKTAWYETQAKTRETNIPT